MGKTFTGETKDAGGQFLGAEFWKKGTRVEGVVQGTFETSNGLSYSLHLTKKVKVDGADVDRVSVGALKGFRMALQAAGVPNSELLAGDAVIIECTGLDDSTKSKGNAMVQFKVLVNRP